MLNKKKFMIFYVVISITLYLLFNTNTHDYTKKEENNSIQVTIDKNNKSTKKETIEWNAYLMCKMFVTMELSPKVSVFPYMERNSTKLTNGLLISSIVQTDDRILNWKCSIIYKGGEMKNPNNWDYNLTF